MTEGQALVLTACLRINQPGPYQIQAAINAVHSIAARAADTNWREILALYDQLLTFAPSPVVALNQIVALAEVEGPASALAALDVLELPPGTTSFMPFALICCRRLGNGAEAVREYDQRRISLTASEAERRFLCGVKENALLNVSQTPASRGDVDPR